MLNHALTIYLCFSKCLSWISWEMFFEIMSLNFHLLRQAYGLPLLLIFLFFCTFFNLQLLDLPGIIEGAKDGKGRGRQVMCGYLSDMIILRRPYMINFYAFIYYGHFCLRSLHSAVKS